MCPETIIMLTYTLKRINSDYPENISTKPERKVIRSSNSNSSQNWAKLKPQEGN